MTRLHCHQDKAQTYCRRGLHVVSFVCFLKTKEEEERTTTVNRMPWSAGQVSGQPRRQRMYHTYR